MSVPKLRFKEFKGKWEEKKLGEVSTVTSGGTPKRTQLKYWNGDIPWITTSLIDFNLIAKADEYITKEGLVNSSAKLFPKETLLMAMYGQGKTRGKLAILDIEATTNQACAAIILNKDLLNTQFVFQNLASRYDEIRNLSNSGSQENLSGYLIKEIPIVFPTIQEQNKIADFLMAVDEKIAQLTQKCELLARYKKGVMQQIFSQELRFKDDGDQDFPDWQKDSLLNLSESGFTNGVFNDSSKVGSGYKLINVLDMYINSTIDDTKLNLVELSEDEFNRNNVKYGDTFFTRSSLVKEGIAHSNVYLGISKDVTFDGHLIRMSPKKDLINPMFFYYLLKTPQIRQQFVTRGKTTTMTTIGQADIATVVLNFPSIKEQTKIANFLTSIDEKITEAQSYLDIVKQYKQGSLQQMFV